MSTAQLRCEELASVDRIWHLKQSGLMEGLSLEDLNAVVSACKDRIYSRGEVVFDQGDPADSLYILNRGCVRMSVSNPNDREKTLGGLQGWGSGRKRARLRGVFSGPCHGT